MNVIPLTVLLSVLLAAFFVVMFLRERSRQSFHGSESTALRPLDEDDSFVCAGSKEKRLKK